jgi:hypothetical protein
MTSSLCVAIRKFDGSADYLPERREVETDRGCTADTIVDLRNLAICNGRG